MGEKRKNKELKELGGKSWCFLYRSRRDSGLEEVCGRLVDVAWYQIGENPSSGLVKAVNQAMRKKGVNMHLYDEGKRRIVNKRPGNWCVHDEDRGVVHMLRKGVLRIPICVSEGE